MHCIFLSMRKNTHLSFHQSLASHNETMHFSFGRSRKNQTETMAMVPEGRLPASSDQLTVVELFQSQGCSSCPPANDNVLALTEDPNMLVLTYGVTYWDYLGWKDTFGSSIFDSRQRAYARTLQKRNVYTPQVSLRFGISRIEERNMKS